MRLKHLLMFNAIVSGVNGIVAVSMPAVVLSLYGVAAGATVTFMSRYAGLGSIAIALVAWLMRNVDDAQAQRAVICAFLITNAVGVAISLAGTVSGAMARGWPVVTFYLVLALGYAYFQVTGPISSTKQAASVSEKAGRHN